MPKISVVIPTFKRPYLLRKCLSSLAKQNFVAEDYEVLIVSDGPDEITMKLVGEFVAGNKNFFLHQMPIKRGPAAARNYGWQKANGILIAFTDDDTLPDPDWLHDIWKAYNGEKEIAFTGRVKVPLHDPPTDFEKNTAGLETAEFVTANCCCSKAALEKVGGFDERFEMAWREDSDLHFKLILSEIPIVRLENALVVHPARSAPWGVSIKEQKKGMFNALLYKKYPLLYRQKIQPAPPWNYYVMVMCVLLFIIALCTGNKSLQLLSSLVWMVFFMNFSYTRLIDTATTPAHVAEMIITSACIPFISIYWQLYGAWRYKVLFF
jgi:GT2 family glycosyltransferase